MWEEKILTNKISQYFGKIIKKRILKSLEGNDALHLIEEGESGPYLEGLEIRKVRKYNPNFDDNKSCICGHPYHRHFDSYEDMADVGCKYCPCNDFEENKEKEI